MAKYKRNPSIIQDKKICYLTGVEGELDPHEPIGNSNKKNSMEDGLWIWVTREMHRWLHDTHEGRLRNKELQAEMQLAWEGFHYLGSDRFRERYFKSYVGVE